MIYDMFQNVKLYRAHGQTLLQGLAYAAGFDPSQPDGRYEIDGKRLYAMVMSYETKPAEELVFEGHRKYIDVQLLLEGREFMDVSLDTQLEVTMPYSEEKDAALFAAPERFTSVLLEPGVFAVLFPEDLHRPSRRLKDSQQVRKMVIKVHIND